MSGDPTIQATEVRPGGSSYIAAGLRPWGPGSQLSSPSSQVRESSYPGYRILARGSSYPAAGLRPWGPPSQLSSLSSQVRGSKYPGHRSQARGSSYPAAGLRPWGPDWQLSSPSRQVSGSSYPGHRSQPKDPAVQLWVSDPGVQIGNYLAQAVRSGDPAIQTTGVRPRDPAILFLGYRSQPKDPAIQAAGVSPKDPLSNCRSQAMGSSPNSKVRGSSYPGYRSHVKGDQATQAIRVRPNEPAIQPTGVRPDQGIKLSNFPAHNN
jgi:hypothetical protein